MDIKSRAADYDRDIFASQDILECLLNVFIKFGHIKDRPDLADINEVVGNESPLLRKSFCCTDVHSAIDLH